MTDVYTSSLEKANEGQEIHAADDKFSYLVRHYFFVFSREKKTEQHSLSRDKSDGFILLKRNLKTGPACYIEHKLNKPCSGCSTVKQRVLSLLLRALLFQVPDNGVRVLHAYGYTCKEYFRSSNEHIEIKQSQSLSSSAFKKEHRGFRLYVGSLCISSACTRSIHFVWEVLFYFKTAR